MNNNLKSSEKKLVQIFMIGALLFLIIFETIFLGSRYYIETQDHKKNFLQETNRIMDKKFGTRWSIPSFIGIESIQTNLSGEIISSQIRDLTIENISDILDEDALEELVDITDAIISSDGYLIRKIQNSWYITFFFTQERVNETVLYRDIMRFILLNIIVLVPIWFLIRYYIRRVLKLVQENLDTMTHFVHDAGHELKTPLAIMSGNLQILRDSPRMDYELVEESLKTIDAMNESIQWLLELADLKIPEDKNKTDIQKVIEMEIERANNFRNVKFEKKFLKNFSVFASEKHLSLLFRNLIENAIKYNKDNGEVIISLEKNTITIEDTWIGMDKENAKRIFDRFYRINQNSSVGGSGIGMTLVKKVIDLYDWKISVDSQENIGTKITITFL